MSVRESPGWQEEARLEGRWEFGMHRDRWEWKLAKELQWQEE